MHPYIACKIFEQEFSKLDTAAEIAAERNLCGVATKELSLLRLIRLSYFWLCSQSSTVLCVARRALLNSTPALDATWEKVAEVSVAAFILISIKTSACC